MEIISVGLTQWSSVIIQRHVGLLLDNAKEAAIQQPLLINGYANKYVSTVKIAQQQWNGVFWAVRAEML
jgi:hypothetical protein